MAYHIEYFAKKTKKQKRPKPNAKLPQSDTALSIKEGWAAVT